MINKYFKYAAFLIAEIMAASCGQLDYEDKEFYMQEVYIINAESTSPSERTITNVLAYTFSDTLRVLNDDYDTQLIVNEMPGTTTVKYKVGIGGSLPASEDIVVKVQFNPEAVTDYNIERNDSVFIPDKSLYSVNVPQEGNLFTVTIPKGESSASIIFTIPILRANMTDYRRYAFPMKVVSCEKAPLSRQYTEFLITGLIVNSVQTTDWSGFPIPKLPEGRWYSQRLHGNVNENTSNGILREYKYITHMGDTPDLKDKYIVWGTSVWSFENQGFHNSGWMYNMLSLNDEVRGTYTLEPIKQGDANFPSKTFTYTSVNQEPSENNKYDPKTKTLTLYYNKVPTGDNQTDILIYMGDEKVYGEGYDQWTWPNTVGGGNYPCRNWYEVRNRGFKYWLPIDE